MSPHDEPSYGGRVGTSKQDNRLSYTPPRKEEDIEFKLNKDDMKDIELLTPVIGEIKIVPDTGLNQLLYNLRKDIEHGKIHLSRLLAEGFTLANGIKPREMSDYAGHQVINYVTQAEVLDYYLSEVAEKLKLI